VGWTDVLTRVDRVEFMWLNPGFLPTFRKWDVGADNLTTEDAGGTTPVSSST